MTDEIFCDASILNSPSSLIAIAFHTFGLQHLITSGAILALCAFLIWAAKSPRQAKRAWLGRLLGCILVGYAGCVYVQEAFAHALSWQYSLPLNLCDLVLIACILSLFRPSRFLSEIAYFWGFGGVLQATVTPDLAQGFPSWSYLMFFWGHGGTLLAIVFLISDPNFRLHKNSITRMMLALNAYALVVGVINATTGWNYGYLCRKPSMPSLMDYLGPWPWYLLSLELIAFLTFLVLNRIRRLLVWFNEPDNTSAK